MTRDLAAPGESRRLVEYAHARLREGIITNRIPANSSISQVKLADELGVSRTPLREALRLLQHEGLAKVEANKRVTISQVDPADLDALYAMRIQQESLAVFHATKQVSDQDRHRSERDLEMMFQAIQDDDIDAWSVAHRRFHLSMAQGLHARYDTSISRHFDHAERYRHIYLTDSDVNWSQSSRDHSAIFESFSAGDAARVAEQVAEHYGRTATSVMRSIDPDYKPALVPSAINMALSLRFIS
ncbi:GntR family transcriptional regulator [Brevibacterium sp. H602]|uniref:GntR family transcriptional regulator n=1 Tax=unclassified Brevibacterium TaxID=2614124 RepID=UPI00397D801B